MNRIITAVKD